MAEVISLGLHRPSALAYLIAESILPPDPSPSTYVWDTYPGSGDVFEEEVLFTHNCVVWSQDGHVRRLFNFSSGRDQKVHQALLTHFRRGIDKNHNSRPASTRWATRNQSYPDLGSGDPQNTTSENPPAEDSTLSRALVILHANEIHVHFLSGSSHVVHVPFDVGKAYAAVEGLVLQRKRSAVGSIPPSQELPDPPANSFFSYPAAGSGHKPHQAKRQNHGASNIPQLEPLFRDLYGNHDLHASDHASNLYSFKDPLSDFPAISHAVYCRQTRNSRSHDAGRVIVEYEALDPAEELIYVSPSDELADSAALGDLPLMILVTHNQTEKRFTVWQAWYLRPQTLAALLVHRAAVKAARLRRRSSHVSNGRPPVLQTPAARARDRTRESFAASARLPTEIASAKAIPIDAALRDPEEAMASQMDPDYVLSKQSGKMVGRMSSLLSRGDVSHQDPNLKQTALGASFGARSRRGLSVGSYHDRRSFGSYAHRKSRASTPGSVFSKSFGPDDEGSMTDDEYDYMDHEFEAVERMVQASHQSLSAESVFGSTPDLSRKELILRKVESLDEIANEVSYESSSGMTSDNVRVCTLATRTVPETGGRRVAITILNKKTRTMHKVLLQARKRTSSSLQHEIAASESYMPILVAETRSSIAGVEDMTKVSEGGESVILMAMTGRIARIMPISGLTWPIRLPERLQLTNSSQVRLALRFKEKHIGRSRTVELGLGEHRFGHASLCGHVTLHDSSGADHRLRMTLFPQHHIVRQILRICQYVLRGKEGQSLQSLWCATYSRYRKQTLSLVHGLDAELDALIVTLFTFAVGSVGRSMRINHSSRAAEQEASDLQLRGEPYFVSRMLRRTPSNEFGCPSTSSWAWLREGSRQDRRHTPNQRSKRKRDRPSGAPQSSTISMAEYEAMARQMLHQIATDELQWLADPKSAELRALCSMKIMTALHLFREEQKLDIASDANQGPIAESLSAVVAQFGTWLGFRAWSFASNAYHELDGAPDSWNLSQSVMNGIDIPLKSQLPDPPSIFEWGVRSFAKNESCAFLSLEDVACIDGTAVEKGMSEPVAEQPLLPRLAALRALSVIIHPITTMPPSTTVVALQTCGLDSRMMETFPEAIRAPLREAIVRCQDSPPTTWPPALLRIVGREDLTRLLIPTSQSDERSRSINVSGSQLTESHDIQAVYVAADRAPPIVRTHEAERHTVISLIFSEDRRFVDASKLMNAAAVQLAECQPLPEWSEADYLEQQKKVMQWVMVRTVALSAGDAMIHFESQRPLLSERFPIKGFSTSCQMKPMDNTISADRSGFTEENFSWAFFHAGVSAGLSISRHIIGIDTSWIVFNKPAELNNRHAGFLLALGINGHLRAMVKWLAFKYLTPKHNMTSIGLLLGLSASFLGSMDTLITRMLSVHITRMLPPGAAELNVSPTTQTAGLMGVGLLYYNTQHRRMSEIMLTEIEHRTIEEPGSPIELLRDESYRLAAGFALGYINLGKGKELRGPYGSDLLERLLTVAVGPRPVEQVHVADKAIAGAVIGIALIYMKTGDSVIAQKIDVPDTIAQMDHVRPDILLLRTLAKHLILWDQIGSEKGWIRKHLPKELATRYYGRLATLARPPRLTSEDIPFFNIVTGLASSLSLKHAGSANIVVRDEVLDLLQTFIAVSKQEAYYYDAKLARSTVKRCIDVLALAAAVVMAGTGDLDTFRYLRSLHGRTDGDTTYGSHLATHLGIGVLFLGGGTYTLGTSNFAIASLICAFYPLYPIDVLDNRVHLQAFRHLWVFAAEARCIVVQDVDSKRPIHVELAVTMKTGDKRIMRAPCLLPDLDEIALISTNDPAFWQVALDFASNPQHLAAFRCNQTIHVRHRPVCETASTVFSSALASLNDAQFSSASRQMWEWVLRLPAFRHFDQADLGLVLPPDANSSVYLDERGTVLDTRLILAKSVTSLARNDFWNLRLLFALAQNAMEHGDGRLKWIGYEVVDMLRAGVAQRMQKLSVAR